MTAAEFCAAELAAGRLTSEHVAELVRAWQASHELEVDGKPGAHTIPTIDAAIAARVRPVVIEPQLPDRRCWPLRALGDSRKPMITSSYRHPARPTHVGVDIFYARKDTDPPMRVGDGGRTEKWWIPDNTRAIAVADARVSHATWTRTGYHVRLAFAEGYSAGYFHLASLAVTVGQAVVLGEPVGIVGDNPDDHDARHLHFEIYRGHTGWTRVNPELLLAAAVVLPAR